MSLTKLVSSLKFTDQVHDLLRHSPEGVTAKAIFKRVLKQRPPQDQESADLLLATLTEDRRFYCDESGRWHTRPVQDPDGAIWETSYVAFDIEATGSHPVDDRLIEVGAVRVQNGVLEETFSSLVSPEDRRIPRYVEEMTGITNRMVQTAPSADEVIPKLIEFFGDAVLIAHNAVFDRRFLRSQYALRMHKTFPNPSICTLRMSKRLFGNDVIRYNLLNVCTLLGIETSDRHRALGDALACARLFVRLTGMLGEMHAARLADLLQFESRGTFQGIGPRPDLPFEPEKPTAAPVGAGSAE